MSMFGIGYQQRGYELICEFSSSVMVALINSVKKETRKEIILKELNTMFAHVIDAAGSYHA